MKININSILVHLQEGYTTVRCSFPNSLTKYSYKAKLSLGLKRGDQAIVKTPSGEYKMVDVMGIDNKPDINEDASFLYSWIVQKVNKAEHLESMQQENELIILIKETKAMLLDKPIGKTAKPHKLVELIVEQVQEIQKRNS